MSDRMQALHLSSLSPWLSWPVAATSFLVYMLTVAVYRLFFHPLASFPGPKLAAITRWYEGYYDVVQNGQYTFKIKQLHRTYGPIVRISPHELHVYDPAFFSTLFCQEGRWDRYAWAWDAFGAEGPTMHAADHHRHKARRQPLAPFFSKAKVASHQGIIRRQVEKLCSRLSDVAAKGPDATVNIGAAISALARDVAFEFLLAKNYNSLDSADFDVAIFHAARAVGPLWRTTKHVRFLFPLLQAIPVEWAMKISDDTQKTFFKHMKAAMNDTKEILDAASSGSPDVDARRTMVHEILDSKLPERDKSFKRIYEDVTAVSGAGFETVGAVLRLVCFHIFSNVELLRRLRTEVCDIKATHPGELQVKTLEQLPFLTATIMEGLRLSPGLATRMQRIAPDRDLIYHDFRIPAGTPVGMTTILMHTDEELYPNPQAFRPERWLHNGKIKAVEKGYEPFSKGTRICLGIHLAWAELYLVIAALVERFDFRFISAKAEDFECVSDQFVIGIRGDALLQASVTMHEERRLGQGHEATSANID